MSKSELKPAVVFEQFAKINQIPRPSKREEKRPSLLESTFTSKKAMPIAIINVLISAIFIIID